jgi:hypothetical protein
MSTNTPQEQTAATVQHCNSTPPIALSQWCAVDNAVPAMMMVMMLLWQ